MGLSNNGSIRWCLGCRASNCLFDEGSGLWSAHKKALFEEAAAQIGRAARTVTSAANYWGKNRPRRERKWFSSCGVFTNGMWCSSSDMRIGYFPSRDAKCLPNGSGCKNVSNRRGAGAPAARSCSAHLTAPFAVAVISSPIGHLIIGYKAYPRRAGTARMQPM